MTPEQLDAIERAAKAATPGPNFIEPADAAFALIAMLTPATVLALVARARRAEELECAIDAIEAVSGEGGVADLEYGWDEMKSIAAAVRSRRRLEP